MGGEGEGRSYHDTGGDCSGGDSSEEDEDLEAKAAYVSGHFSKEELKDLDEIHHDIKKCIGILPSTIAVHPHQYYISSILPL